VIDAKPTNKSEIKRLVYEIENKGGRVLFTQDVIEQQQRKQQIAELAKKQEQEQQKQQENEQGMNYEISYRR
jgi:hypothetical protein